MKNKKLIKLVLLWILSISLFTVSVFIIDDVSLSIGMWLMLCSDRVERVARDLGKISVLIKSVKGLINEQERKNN